LVGDEEIKEGLLSILLMMADRLISLAKSRGIEKIKYIVNTHFHVDHVMGNAEMKKKTGAKIIIHEKEAAVLTEIPSSYLGMFRLNRLHRPTFWSKKVKSFKLARLSSKSFTHRAFSGGMSSTLMELPLQVIPSLWALLEEPIFRDAPGRN